MGRVSVNVQRYMFNGLKSQVKQWTRRNWTPILLPQYQVRDGGIMHLEGAINPAIRQLSSEIIAALLLCDGKTSAREITGRSKVSMSQLLELEKEQVILFWPNENRTIATRTEPEAIILSPHLDDAALSIGSYMLAMGRTGRGFDLIDVFSTVSWWRHDLKPEILPTVQRTRDSEEHWIAHLTGSKLEKWALGEAPLRTYPLKEIFTTARKEEAAATHQIIRRKVADRAQQNPKQDWILPLAIGNHIDHRIAREAGLDGLRDAGVSPTQISFMEDLPYAAQTPGVKDYSNFLDEIISGCKLKIKFEWPVTKEKHRLLQFYGSQLTLSQIRMVHDYASRLNRRTPIERLWMFDDATIKKANGKIPELTGFG